MKEIPIIFSAAMVRALLEGRKTMTRRLLYTERKCREEGIIPAKAVHAWRAEEGGTWHVAPASAPFSDRYFDLTGWERVTPGDRLWVRENFSGPWALRNMPPSMWGDVPAWYWADGN